MSASDLFVLPSRYEGFARVLMEAAASAKPIITTDVSGSDDAVIHEKTGHILPIDDHESFLECIKQFINNPQTMEIMGASGRKHMRLIASRYGDMRLQIEIWEKILSKHVK